MREYQKLASYLETLKPDAKARVSYEIFAGGLVWSDEVPVSGSYSLDDFNPAELRALWNYRSSVILGNPKERFRASWEAAQKCFPHWPGFDPRRCDACWAETLKALEEKAMKEWTELDGRLSAAAMQKATT